MEFFSPRVSCDKNETLGEKKTKSLNPRGKRVFNPKNIK
jgi:hypothetical protein